MKGIITVGEKIGAAMVIGAGVGGIQAALDLAELGFKVYIVEASPAIGGIMSQLDKTFPTNDCSMCILAPKMVEVARNPNIELLTLSEVTKIEGEVGNFIITVKKNARYIDITKCTNCGLCTASCPIRIPSDYNEKLTLRGASYIPFPQAVPSANLIDSESCLFLQKGVCRLCEKVCKAEAINFEQKDELITLNVGAVILSVGVPVFDASNLSEYGYGRHENVVNSLEFERILNASGPFGGHVIRPSDRTTPRKILWLNCIGSRNRKINNDYCSSVCCMYSIKEALITKEHNPDIDCYIFYIDIRAVGKGFDEYYENAKKLGIKLMKTRALNLEEDPVTQNILVSYENQEKGDFIEEEFDLVVLSVGLQPSNSTKEFCQKFGIELDKHGFCLTQPYTPLETTKQGIYSCGTISSPKDIPETVAEASGAAGKVSSILYTERYKLIEEKEYPPEFVVKGKEPRIGAFICHCGINIGSVVNISKVVKFVKTLPNVVYAEENLYTCSQDTQEKIKQLIKEHELNRIVVASCTPRTHEPLFQNTVREAGLNPYLFELANIREHCSWVHMNEPEEATEKAKEIVEMTIQKVRFSEPLYETFVDVTHAGLVIGGGIAGLTAAIELANQNFKVYLVEKQNKLGGEVQKIHYLFEGIDPQKYLEELIDKARNLDKISIFLNTEIKDIAGYVGNFKIKVNSQGELKELEAGVIIVATGGTEYRPTEYLYGQDERILTQHELEQKIFENSFRCQKIVMIQCVGSRNTERPYCSKICCSTAIKNALKIKEINPDAIIYVLYRDIRTYGLSEEYYEKAREKGVNFLKFDPENPPKISNDKKELKITLAELISRQTYTINPDFVILSAAFIPTENNELSQMLKVPLDQNGFFQEAHVKLRPLDFATDGIFLCGTAHWPKTIKESIAQAIGATTRATRILSAKKLKTDAIIAFVNQELCMGCRTCEWNCPYKAIEVQSTESGQKAIVVQSACKGCGICGANCPQKAISMHRFTDMQIIQQINSLCENLEEKSV